MIYKRECEDATMNSHLVIITVIRSVAATLFFIVIHQILKKGKKSTWKLCWRFTVTRKSWLECGNRPLQDNFYIYERYSLKLCIYVKSWLLLLKELYSVTGGFSYHSLLFFSKKLQGHSRDQNKLGTKINTKEMTFRPSFVSNKRS